VQPFSYQEQEAALSLQAGLEEYRSGFTGLLDESELPSRAARFFRAHDICHVVFGCDTSVPQEAMADTWSVFGTSLGFEAYLDYLRLPQANNIFRQVGYGRTAWETLRVSPRLVRVMIRARQMARPWPFWDNDQYLDVPLKKIREEFNIRLV
jgi:hypothetical protein